MRILLKTNFFIKYIMLFILLSMYSAFAEEQTITFEDAAGDSEEVQGPTGEAAKGDDAALQGARIQPVGWLPADAASVARADRALFRVPEHH